MTRSLLSVIVDMGDIPRSVCQYLGSDKDILGESISQTDVMYALQEVGSRTVDHRKVSDAILHLVPDESLMKWTFQWGSTEIMI
jgi:hypothetical protein